MTAVIWFGSVLQSRVFDILVIFMVSWYRAVASLISKRMDSTVGVGDDNLRIICLDSTVGFTTPSFTVVQYKQRTY